MTARSKSEIKAFFETGDRPTQTQFSDLVDSYIDTSAAGTVGLRILGAVTSASAASQMGFGTLATQDANNVNITGGNLGSVTVSAATINTPTVTSGTFNSPILNNPTVSGGTLNSPTVNTPTVSGGTTRLQTITSATVNGSTINNAPYVFTSWVDATVGLGTANAYFPIVGRSANPNLTIPAQNGGAMATSGVIRAFTANLGVAASGGTRTFSIQKTGSTTGITITFGSAMNGSQTVAGSANFVAGDYLEILSSVNGTPVNNSGCQFSVYATINNS